MIISVNSVDSNEVGESIIFLNVERIMCSLVIQVIPSLMRCNAINVKANNREGDTIECER